jgi:hypothetical protein
MGSNREIYFLRLIYAGGLRQKETNPKGKFCDEGLRDESTLLEKCEVEN